MPSLDHPWYLILSVTIYFGRTGGRMVFCIQRFARKIVGHATTDNVILYCIIVLSYYYYYYARVTLSDRTAPSALCTFRLLTASGDGIQQSLSK